MDWLNILNELFEVCIIPLLGFATVMLIKLVNTKINQATEQTKSDTADKYLRMLETTVVDCIRATNQTYVNALKGQNAFDANAQKEALTRTKDAIMAILTEDAKQYLSGAVGDLEMLVTEKIEANIQNAKQ